MKCAKTYFDAVDWRLLFLASAEALHMGNADARTAAT